MGLQKKLDMLFFVLIQYLIPTAALPDLVMMLARHRLSLFSPLTGFTIFLAFWGMSCGLRQVRSDEKLSLSELTTIGWQTLRGVIYMLHWAIIIPSIATRMSVRPKRLKWVKTVHEGTSEESFEFQ
jgi:1,2-diacylglycerol 3-beta-glucosyltransferase